jgi:transposase-like protein
MTPLERVEAALRDRGCRQAKNGKWSCPAHEDSTPSLSVRSCSDGGIAIKCFAGCTTAQIVAELGVVVDDLLAENIRAARQRKGGEGGKGPPRNNGSMHQRPTGSGLTLAEYAAAKRLPRDFLETLGVREVPYFRAPALEIPYRDSAGQAGPVRYRLLLEKGPEGDDRFRWKKGSKALPYGLWRLERALSAGYVVLVEGESDAQTLWSHGIPALGIPGATAWRNEWAAFLEDFERSYAVVEPDKGGEAFRAKLTASPLRDRLRFVSLAPHKDASALHVSDPEGFKAALEAALQASIPAVEGIERERREQTAAAWEKCKEIAEAPHILDLFISRMAEMGAVGEDRAGKLIFLCIQSRLLDRIVSAVVKGPSSAGKSFTVERVLMFFPPSAFYSLSGMSERFLVYDPEPLKHRIVVISEAAALEEGLAVYLVRTLLSEGRLIYGTTDKDADGKLCGRRIEKEGPTGVLLTTTAVRLHAENETRLFSIPMDDTAAQTKRVLESLADGADASVDVSAWHALQEWLQTGERRVVIPYAAALARQIPPAAVRLRRDFHALLSLIRAHALLHRATRKRDMEGRIVATLDDYAVVRELVADLMGEAVQATVSKTVRETVAAAVEALLEGDAGEVSVAALAKRLGIDKAAASRRYRAAGDYLVNNEEKRGRPARIVLGEALPEERELLPTPEALGEVLTCCAVEGGETEAPLPPSDTEWFD